MSGKTRSALRSTLKKEDEALAARLPEVAPETPEPAVPASVDAPVVAEVPEAATPAEPVTEAPATDKPAAPVVKAAPKPRAPAKRAVKAPAAAPAAKADDKPAPAKPAKVAAPAASKAKVAKPEKPAKVEKPAKSPKAEKPVKPLKAEKPAKVVRDKVVRDSFSMPKSEHAQLKALREALARAGRICTKSELLRAGVQLLLKEPSASAKALVEALSVVPKGKSAK